VPARALQRVGPLDLVEVLSGKDNLERRFVRVGRTVGDKVEMLSGLSAEDKVALP
jgi:multidrug efflux pump subunit AcrA (membrane-fusion protein)